MSRIELAFPPSNWFREADRSPPPWLVPAISFCAQPFNAYLPPFVAPATQPMKILHLEDSPMDAELVSDFLHAEWPACQIKVVADRPHFVSALQEGPHDVILSDFSMAAFSGWEGFRLARESEPETPFIFFSGTIREEVALDAVRDGAADYVLKDRPMRLISSIRTALAKRDEARRRQQAETLIREQNDLLDKASDAIVVTDLEGRVIFWNQGAVRMLGWGFDEVAGLPGDEIMGVNPLAVNFTQGEWRGEVTVRNKAGQVLCLQTHMTAVADAEGVPRGCVSISTDVTEQNRLKEQFFRAQRLESLGLLAAGIAHDLNNMLAPILMAPTILRQRATDATDIKVIEVMEKSAQRGTQLVKQILTFAQGSSTQRLAIQLQPALRDMATFIQQTFPRKITLEAGIPHDLKRVMASATQIHQVLLNLCVNARDAMAEGGKLILRAENVDYDEQAARECPGARPGGWVVVHVEDTGPGIAPEIVSRIWEPFFTTKGLDKGTGLGLSTVRGIVQNHGGFIRLKTAVGQGTCFSIHLPALSPAVEPAGIT